MTKTWLISDTHFGHENIIKYCNRPFKNAEEMDRTLIANWNATVSNKDEIFHLGDFAFVRDSTKREIVRKLNGHKILILGNHDVDKRFNGDIEDMVDRYLDIGFDEVFIEGEIRLGGFRLRHHPGFDGQDTICGHVHDLFTVTNEKLEDYHMNRQDKTWKDAWVPTVNVNVGVERWGYKPVLFEDVKKEFDKFYGV